MMQLYTGNKNYSSWSMRAWLILKHFDLPFQDHFVAFDDFSADGQFKQQVSKLSPAGKVPVLLHDQLAVWDTLAIAEYLAEQFPEKQLWPQDRLQRAKARTVAAEMHSGFMQLRSLCPMNIEADLSAVGQQLWQQHVGLRQDVQRVEQIWSEADGFLFGDFSIADAFYAPVVMRLMSYRLPVTELSQQYMQKIQHLPAVRQWMDAAKREHLFVQADEPYRTSGG